MTQQQEMRFRCDRCHTEISVPLNDQPAMERGRPPKEWLSLHLDAATSPARHLCPSCGGLFRDFMEECGHV